MATDNELQGMDFGEEDSRSNYRLLSQLLADMQQHRYAKPFAQPLNIQPYMSGLRNPMDLSTILRKLNGGLYRRPEDFIKDAQKMFDAGRSYMRGATPYGMNAADLLECTLRLEKFMWTELEVIPEFQASLEKIHTHNPPRAITLTIFQYLFEELEVAVRLKAKGGGDWLILSLDKPAGSSKVQLLNKTCSKVDLQVATSWTRFNNGLTLCLRTSHAKEAAMGGRPEQDSSPESGSSADPIRKFV
jgi:hypothetical protein